MHSNVNLNTILYRRRRTVVEQNAHPSERARPHAAYKSEHKGSPFVARFIPGRLRCRDMLRDNTGYGPRRLDVDRLVWNNGTNVLVRISFPVCGGGVGIGNLKAGFNRNCYDTVLHVA